MIPIGCTLLLYYMQIIRETKKAIAQRASLPHFYRVSVPREQIRHDKLVNFSEEKKHSGSFYDHSLLPKLKFFYGFVGGKIIPSARHIQ